MCDIHGTDDVGGYASRRSELLDIDVLQPAQPSLRGFS
jgi:hypothetical protein